MCIRDRIDTKAGDAYGVPAGTKYGVANNGTEPVELLMYAAPLIAPNPANKPLKGRADDMEWVVNTTHGPGCEQKMLLRGGFSSVIRNMWLMKGNPGSVNMVHSGGDHQIMYFWVAPVPSATPVSYTHLDVYKRQAVSLSGNLTNALAPNGLLVAAAQSNGGLLGIRNTREDSRFGAASVTTQLGVDAEMCIRDSVQTAPVARALRLFEALLNEVDVQRIAQRITLFLHRHFVHHR